MASTGGRRDDWRTSGTGGGRAGPRAAGKGKGGRKWVVAALVVALLGGLLVSLPFFARRPVEPLVLALPVSEYHKSRDSRWPPNPWAEADARGLRDRFGGESAQAFQNQEKAAITRELASFVKRADDEKKPLVVYLTALGTVSGDTPYLLPADARPDDPASWLALDDVLDPLRRGSTSRLLILDVRPVRSPRAALPPADVNELIDAKLAARHQADDLPLLVLTANTPAAGPLAVPSHKHTAFGLALDRGVGGGADGWAANIPKDGDVTARELAEYARETTHAVTGGTQRPQLYGQGGDFRLLTLPPTPPPPPEVEPRAYPPFLEDAWKDVEAARKDGLHLRAPRAVRQQTDAAVEAERWWLAGTADETVQGRYAKTFADFKAELKGTALAPPRPPVASVARARRVAPDFDKQQKAAEGLLRGVVTALKSDAPAAEQKAELAKAVAAFKEGLGKQNVPFPAAAAAVWAAAREQAELKFIRGLVAVADDLPNATPTAELAALKLIAAADPRRAVDWPADAVRQWMDATEAGEEAAEFDPRALPLVEKALAAADGLYRDGVKDLADTGLPDARMKGAVPNFQKARDGYKAVRAVTDAADFAWGQVEETRAALADLADRYPHELTRAPGLKECSLRDLTDAFSEVVTALHPGDAAAVDPAELKQAAQRLRDRRRALVTPIRLPAGNDPRAIEDALGWPGWVVADRKDLVGRLQTTTAAAVANWPTGSTRQELAAPPSQRERVYGDSLRDLRNRVDLVRVWDAKKAGEFRADVGDGRRPTAERFSTVVVAVLAEVRDGPRKRADQDEWMRPLLGWAVDPIDRPALPADDPGRNPETAARRQAESRLASWYAGRQTAMSTAVAGFARAAADRYSAVAAEVTK